MDDTGDPQGHDLAETTRRQNSNMQRLIDAVGSLLTASRELLKRLQSADAKQATNQAAVPDAASATASEMENPDDPSEGGSVQS